MGANAYSRDILWDLQQSLYIGVSKHIRYSQYIYIYIYIYDERENMPDMYEIYYKSSNLKLLSRRNTINIVREWMKYICIFMTYVDKSVAIY